MMCSNPTPGTSRLRQPAGASAVCSAAAGASASAMEAGQPTAARDATGGSQGTITTSPSGSSPAEWILPFGGHAGKPIGQVPDGYLEWMIGKGVFHHQARAELSRRESLAIIAGDEA